jgi:hypothetical protein
LRTSAPPSAPRRPRTRRPKIDRVACPWLIRRFIDRQACILYDDPDQVVNVAKESGGVACGIGGTFGAGRRRRPWLLQQGFVLYDALFACLRLAARERDNWPAKAA